MLFIFHAESLIYLIILSTITAFNFEISFAPLSLIPRKTSTSTELYGSWGKRKKEFTEAEFAREGGDRRGFDNYELQQRSDFMAKLQNDRSKLMKKKDDEFLEIARMAGITDQSDDGVDPMGDFIADDDPFMEENTDDIDVRVYFEDDDDDVSVEQNIDFDPDTSITRLDGPSDVAGIGGEW